MSRMKDHFFELEQERFLEWARARHGGDFLDEESEAYQALAQEYADMNDAFEQEAEYQWLQRQSFHEQYIEFSAELDRARVLLRDSVNGPHTQTTCKLVYAHSVTLLETMVSTSVNALVLKDRAFLLNMARQIESIQKGKKITLVEVVEHPRGVEGVILKALSEITFHNPATIKTVLVALIGDGMKDLDVSGFGSICRVRHPRARSNHGSHPHQLSPGLLALTIQSKLRKLPSSKIVEPSRCQCFFIRSNRYCAGQIMALRLSPFQLYQ